MEAVQRKKILVPIFNRAHYGRLRSVLKAIQQHPNLTLQVITAIPAAHDHFFLNLRHSRPHSWRLALPWYIRARLLSFLEWFSPKALWQSDFLIKHITADGFTVAARVPLFLDGGIPETMAKSVGLGIFKIVDVLKKLKPDLVFVNADRFEMMAVTLAAAYMNIPVAHNEGGDVSGTIDESIRHAITKFAHVHFTATETSRKRVLQMGENPAYVFTVGSPVIDWLKTMDKRIPDNLLPGIDIKKPYAVIVLHPVATDTSEQNVQMTANLIRVLEGLQIPTVFLGSNIDGGSDDVGKTVRAWRAAANPSFAFFAKHLPPDDFYRVLANAVVAVGNSSSFIREGAYFGTPTVIIGSRQRNRDRGKNVMEVGVNVEEIKKGIEAQLRHGRYPSDKLFGDGQTGKRIAELLATTKPNIQKEFHEI